MAKLGISYRTKTGRRVMKVMGCREVRATLRRMDPESVVCLVDAPSSRAVERCAKVKTLRRQMQKYGFGECKRPGHWRR